MGKFKLQIVLDYRARLEELAQQEHVAARQKETALQQQLGDTRQELTDLQIEFEDLQSKGMLPQEFVMYSNHLNHLTGIVDDLIVACAAARAEVDGRLDALCKAGQEKKLLEKLKERHSLSEQVLARQKESALLDEIAVQKFKRKI
jgi:flagellar FliJ protein